MTFDGQFNHQVFIESPLFQGLYTVVLHMVYTCCRKVIHGKREREISFYINLVWMRKGGKEVEYIFPIGMKNIGQHKIII